MLGSPLRLATACSGSECPVLWLAAFWRVTRSKVLNLPLDHPRCNPWASLKHVFGCEINNRKCSEWILRFFDPDILFKDLTHLGRRVAYDVRSDSMKLVHAAKGLRNPLCEGFTIVTLGACSVAVYGGENQGVCSVAAYGGENRNLHHVGGVRYGG